jgi:hypothetical protein
VRLPTLLRHAPKVDGTLPLHAAVVDATPRAGNRPDHGRGGRARDRSGTPRDRSGTPPSGRSLVEKPTCCCSFLWLFPCCRPFSRANTQSVAAAGVVPPRTPPALSLSSSPPTAAATAAASTSAAAAAASSSAASSAQPYPGPSEAVGTASAVAAAAMCVCVAVRRIRRKRAASSMKRQVTHPPVGKLRSSDVIDDVDKNAFLSTSSLTSDPRPFSVVCRELTSALFSVRVIVKRRTSAIIRRQERRSRTSELLTFPT